MKRYNHRTTLTAVLATALLLAACAKSDVISDIQPSIPAGMGELTLGELQLSGNDLPSGGLTPEPAASTADTTPASGATRASGADAADTPRATAATPASGATRATSSALPVGSTLRLYAFEKGKTDFGTKLATRTYTIDAAGAAIIDAGQAPLYLPAGDVDIYLAGPVSHNFGTVDSPQFEEIAAEYGIFPRVGVDLVAAYAASTVTIGHSNPLPAMTLTHKMALVQVVVEAAENAVFENLALKEVKLFAQPLTGSYTLDSDGGIVTPGTAVSEFVYPLIEEETAKIRFSATTVLMPQPSKEFKIETTFECNQKNQDVGDNHPTLRYRQSGLVQEPLAAATATRFTAQPMIPVEIKWRTKVLPWNDVVQDDITTGGITPINPVTPPTADQWVEIDGLKWTKGNLVAKNTHQCMVGDPSDYGVYFQFGSLIGWTGGADGNGTGQGSPTADKRVWPIEMGRTKPTYSWQNKNTANISKLDNYYFNYSANGWGTKGRDLRDFDEPIDGDAGTGTLASGRYAKQGVGDPCTYYLGDPWRLPTQAEIKALFDNAVNSTAWSSVANWSWVTSPYNGAQHQSKPLYVPASGFRGSSDGAFANVNSSGYSWSSSVSSTAHGYTLGSNSISVFPENNTIRSLGSPARCVSGTYVKPVNPVNPPTSSDYVEIDGLKWTKGNLVATSSTASGSNGCKVGAPEDGGLYFQFGSLIGWKGGAEANGGTGVGSNPNTGSGTQWWGGGGNPGANIFSTDAMVWPASMASTPAAWSTNVQQATEADAFKKWYFDFSGTSQNGSINYSTNMSDIRDYTHPDLGALKEGKMASVGVGDPCTYYLGDPWRMPTPAEYAALDGAGRGNWTTNSGVNGRWLGTSPGSASSSVFFPASGLRHYSRGAFYNVTTGGYSWSSSVYSAPYGCYLYFSSSDVFPQHNGYRSAGMPVRCVSGTYVKPVNPVNPPTADQYVEIDGLKWTKGNLVASSSTASGSNGCKVGAPEDGGLYFQFGSLIGWKGGATANGGTGVGSNPNTGSGSQWWGGGGNPGANIFSTDAMVWPASMASTPAAWSPSVQQATEANAFKKWYFDFTGTSQNGSINYSTGMSDIRDYTHPDLGALKEGKMASVGVGDPCTYYLGDPWRMPTIDEYKALFDNLGDRTVWTSVPSWSWVTSPYNGAQRTGNTLYVPASGRRNGTTGAFNYVTIAGYYWSSSVYNAANGYSLVIATSDVHPQDYYSRSNGMLVRCVSGTYVKPVNPVNPPTSSDYVEIDGLKWTKGNLVATSSTASGSNGCKVGAPEDGGLYFQFGSLIGWKGGAEINGGTGVGSNPNTGSGSQWWGGATSWSWSNDAMVWPTTMTSTPTAWSTNAAQATEADAFKKWYFDFSGTSGKVSYATGFSDIRSYAHPDLGALKEGKMASVGVGDPCTYYLGDPWRLPTAAEYKAVFDNANNGTTWPTANWNWTTTPYNGAQRTGNTLYVPASGFRDSSSGAFNNVNSRGYSWSSSVTNATYGYSLFFSSSNVNPQYSYYGRSNGLPVRCVSTAP